MGGGASSSTSAAAAAPKPRHRRVTPASLAVLLSFPFLYTVTTRCALTPAAAWWLPGGAGLHRALLTVCALLALYCLVFVQAVDAGIVPRGWRPPSAALDLEGGGGGGGGGGSRRPPPVSSSSSSCAVAQVKRSTGGARRCAKCARPGGGGGNGGGDSASSSSSLPFKPPRAHHCRVCGVCRLRMDHHCHFAASCVGHRNYRGYLLLLFYGGLALAHVIALVLGHGMAGLLLGGRRDGWGEQAVTVAAGGGGIGGEGAAKATAAAAGRRLLEVRAAGEATTAAAEAAAAAAATTRDDAAFPTGDARLPELARRQRGAAAAKAARAPTTTSGACVAAEVSALALALPACVGVLWLAWWHLKLLLANKTTIEHVEGVAVRPADGAAAADRARSPPLAPAAQAARAAAAAAMTGAPLPRSVSSPMLLAGNDKPPQKQQQPQHLHPWDLGRWRNVASVLGNNPWLWLVPPLQPAKGGLSFRSRWD